MDYDAIRAGCATSSVAGLFRSRAHRAFGEVAAVRHLPFVVSLDQDGTGQPQ